MPDSRYTSGRDMPLRVDDRLASMGSRTPRRVLRGALSAALGDLRAALCLHRVGEPPAGAFLPQMTMPAGQVDELVELLLGSRPGGDRWLSVTFDDGYADAVEYVASRSGRYPEVEFLVFACPEKAERRAGFRWDLVDRDVRGGRQLEEAWIAHMERPRDVLTENSRDELRALAALPEYRLAALEDLRGIARMPNVALGNHTNCHFKASELSPEQFVVEVERSEADFARLFGASGHFAFPYGWPLFDGGHVAAIEARTRGLVWSTTRRPYRAAERRARALLPRFPVDGRWGARGAAAWIAGRAAAFRARGARRGIEEP